FLGIYCKKNGRPRLAVQAEVMQRLSDYSWPGNVRELENTMERAAVLCQGELLTLQDLPDSIARAARSSQEPAPRVFSIRTPLVEVEQRLIRETLRYTSGDKSLAAQLLGISTRTIFRKVE